MLGLGDLLEDVAPPAMSACRLVSGIKLSTTACRIGSLFQSCFHLVLDVTSQGEEGILHVDAGFCTRFHELDPILDGQLFTLFLRNLTPVRDVTLVPQNHLFHVRAGMLLNVPDPVFDVLKGLVVRDVVHQHDPHRAPVVGRRDRPEPLLTCRVPDLQFNLLTVQFDRSNLKVNPCVTRVRVYVRVRAWVRGRCCFWTVTHDETTTRGSCTHRSWR